MPSVDFPLASTPENCRGKTFVVTGSNVGLGFEASQHLALGGAARLVLAVRNVSSGDAAKEKILKAASGSANADPNLSIEVWQLDMASYESVKAFAKSVSTELDHVDGFIANAGVALSNGAKAEGRSLVVTVNVYSTILLALLVLPKLAETSKKTGKKPRLVVVGSNYGFMFPDEFKSVHQDPLRDIEPTPEYDEMRTYRLSKLFDVLLTRHLASLLPASKTGVVMSVVCPGLSTTDLNRPGMHGYEARKENFEKYGISAEEGSRNLLHGLFVPESDHGKFLQYCKDGEGDISAWLTDAGGKDVTQRIWYELSKHYEAVAPGSVSSVIA